MMEWLTQLSDDPVSNKTLAAQSQKAAESKRLGREGFEMILRQLASKEAEERQASFDLLRSQSRYDSGRAFLQLSPKKTDSNLEEVALEFNWNDPGSLRAILTRFATHKKLKGSISDHYVVADRDSAEASLAYRARGKSLEVLPQNEVLAMPGVPAKHLIPMVIPTAIPKVTPKETDKTAARATP